MNAPSTSPTSTPDVTEPVSLPGSTRLMSIDALRGFDMLWIVGAHGFVTALGAMSHWRFFGFLEDQLTHVTWQGMHFYDLIFPLIISKISSNHWVLAQSGRIPSKSRALPYGRATEQGTKP